MMETVVPQHQRRVAANSAFFGGGSSDSGGSSTSTSPSPPDHFGNTHGVFAAQQFSPTAIDSAYVSTTSSPSGAGRFNIWATNTAADAAEDKANNGRRHLFAEYDTRHQVPAGSVREKGCPEAVSLSSSTRLKHSSVAFADKPMRNVFIEPNSGMRDIPMWLKGLRLHKYTTMFQQMDYEQMLGLDEIQLEQQGVTKGARRKILQSVQKLRERVDFLRQLEKDVNEQGGIRTTLIELRAMIHTPIRPYPLPGRPEPIQARIDGLTIPTEEIDPENLPAHLVRVLGKVHMAIFESPETNLEDEYFSVLLQIYERIIHHEAFTLAQKQRVMAWKRTVKKVFSPTLPRRRASYQFPSSGTERRGAGVPPTAGLPAGCLQPAPFASPSMRAAGACSPDRHRRMAPANGRWMQMIHSPSSPSNAPFPAAPVTVEQFALLRDMMAMQQFQLLSMAAHRYSVQALYDQQQQQQQQNGQQQPQQQQPHRVSQPHPQNQQPTSMNGRTWPPELSRHNSAPPNVSQPPLHTQSVHTQSHHKFASTPTSPPVTTASNAPSGVCQSQQFNQLAASLAAANFPHQPAQQRSSGNVGPQQQLSQSQQAPTKQQQQQPSQWPPGLGMDNSPLWTTSTTTNTSDSLVSPVPRPIKAHTFPTGSATATSNQGGSLSGGSDRSGAESPLGLMVYNFCGSQFELDKMCRSVAEMTLDLGSTGIQSKEIAGGY